MKKTSDKAIEYVKKHKNEIVKKFANLLDYPSIDDPFTIFMAGSPGAGKTEFSKGLIKRISENKDSENRKIVRIDADDIKVLIPGYEGKNSEWFHTASILGLERLYDSVLRRKQDAIIDGTLCNYDIACKNIERSLKRIRVVAIYYIYQDPLIAWEFIKEREKKEGRIIPKEVFVEDLFKAKDNVNKIKEKFGSDINVNLVVKNFKSGLDKTEFNIDNIDNFLKIGYSNKELIAKI